MKKYLILFICLIFVTVCRSQNTIIKANIQGLPEGIPVKIYPLTNMAVVVKTQSVKDGFEIKIDIPEGEGDLYNIVANKWRALVYLEKGIFKIAGVDKNEDGFSTSVPFKYSGSKMAIDLTDYQESTKKIIASLTDDKDIPEAKIQHLYAWITSHPASPVAAAFLGISKTNLPEDSVLKYAAILKPQALDNKQGKGLMDFVEARKEKSILEIGYPAPQFSQADTAGKEVSLKDFKGKYLLLDFWASWCVPCRHENPNVVSAYNKYKDKNFTVVSVSLDGPSARKNWMDAIHKDGLNWTHLSDLQGWDNKVAIKYKVKGIPQNYLIDPSGTIIGISLRGEELQRKLEEVLSKTP